MATESAPDVTAFDATARRIDATRRQFPAFPRDPAVLVRLVKHIHRRVHDAANAALREHGLNHTDYDILMMLYGSEGHRIHPSELRAASGEKAANITRICNALVERGLIDRVACADDRRRVVLTLTVAGLQLVGRFLPSMVDLLHAHVDGMDAADMAQLEALLKRMLAGIERVAAGRDEP